MVDPTKKAPVYLISAKTCIIDIASDESSLLKIRVSTLIVHVSRTNYWYVRDINVTRRPQGWEYFTRTPKTPAELKKNHCAD